MSEEIINISFDHKKVPAIDFEILPFESILQRNHLTHNPRHLHRVDFYLLILITSGYGKHTVDFREYELKPGSVLTIRKDQLHCFHNGTHKGFLLLFTEEYALSYLDASEAHKVAELFNELLFSQHTQPDEKAFEEVLTLTRQIEHELQQPFDNHTPGIIRNFLQILTSKIHRIRSVSASLQPDHKYMGDFLKLQRLLEKENQKNKSVAYYATQLGVTSKTLNNITQRILKKPAKQFIDDNFFLKIKRLLINSDLSIKEIAYRSGFEEPSNLFKFFKRQTQMTPESFRKTHHIKD